MFYEDIMKFVFPTNAIAVALCLLKRPHTPSAIFSENFVDLLRWPALWLLERETERDALPAVWLRLEGEGGWGMERRPVRM